MSDVENPQPAHDLAQRLLQSGQNRMLAYSEAIRRQPGGHPADGATAELSAIEYDRHLGLLVDDASTYRPVVFTAVQFLIVELNLHGVVFVDFHTDSLAWEAAFALAARRPSILIHARQNHACLSVRPTPVFQPKPGEQQAEPTTS